DRAERAVRGRGMMSSFRVEEAFILHPKGRTGKKREILFSSNPHTTVRTVETIARTRRFQVFPSEKLVTNRFRRLHWRGRAGRRSVGPTVFFLRARSWAEPT